MVFAILGLIGAVLMLTNITTRLSNALASVSAMKAETMTTPVRAKGGETSRVRLQEAIGGLQDQEMKLEASEGDASGLDTVQGNNIPDFSILNLQAPTVGGN